MKTLALMIADQKQRAHPLGDIPLLVLTAGNAEYGPEQQALDDDRQKNQAGLPTLSRKGTQIIAEGSGHHPNRGSRARDQVNP